MANNAFGATFYLAIALFLIFCQLGNIPAAAKSLAEKRNSLFEGDILVDERISRVINGETDEKVARTVVQNPNLIWTNGIVPYIIDSSIPYGSSTYHSINEAIAELRRSSCVQIIPKKSSDNHFLKFVNSNQCSSYVGKQSMYGQNVNLASHCATKGVVLHELLHALGFFHTSSRPDRDTYVTVNPQNIAPGYEINFRKYSHGQVDSLGAPYDITSIMHLPRDAFSKHSGVFTIVSRAGSDIKLGQRQYLTNIDLYQLNNLYKCASANNFCLSSLGLQDRRIADNAFHASTSQQRYYPGQARLNNLASRYGMGAWCADKGDRTPWIQVDLGGYYHITGIETQGYLYQWSNAFVKEYILDYLEKNRWWYRYCPAYFHSCVLPGNWDGVSAQYNAVKPGFNAMSVKIIPTSWVNQRCLRIELYGCKV